MSSTFYMDFKPTKNSFPPAYKMESQLEEGPFSPAAAAASSGGGVFADPLCKLNLKETSEFVRAFPVAPRCGIESRDGVATSAHARRGRLDVPTTPGRPSLAFYGGNLARKSVPSKWDDAEKWIISTSCRESPAHLANPSRIITTKQGGSFCQKGDAFVEKRIRASEGKSHGSFLEHNATLQRLSLDVPLKDKFTDNVELVFPSFQCSEPTKEGFLFNSSPYGAMKDAATEVATDVKRRDVGTETTPLGSSVTSRCHTPIKTSSPSRHNTPADRSGLLVPPKTSIDVLELKDCHFAKLELGAQFDSVVSNWSSREEEEEEISKSLRHFDMGDVKKSVAESRATAWEDGERTKSCLRYQREEAKIQAWVNLQSAKAEAQSRKLEVKIQKMRANLEEKLMKRMASVHKKAEEWRAAAQLQHSQEVRRASEQAQKIKNQHGICLYDHAKCGCLR